MVLCFLSVPESRKRKCDKRAGGNKLSAQELLFRSVYPTICARVGYIVLEYISLHSPGSLPCRVEVLNAESEDAGEKVVSCWPGGGLGEGRRGGSECKSAECMYGIRIRIRIYV